MKGVVKKELDEVIFDINMRAAIVFGAIMIAFLLFYIIWIK